MVMALVTLLKELPVPSAEQGAGVHTYKHLLFSAVQTVGSAAISGPAEVLRSKGYWGPLQSRALGNVMAATIWLIHIVPTIHLISYPSPHVC